MVVVYNLSAIELKGTLVWIAEKTLVPSNFHRLLKLTFHSSWMFVCNETYIYWKAKTSAFISHGYIMHGIQWWQWILLFIILVWKLCFDFCWRASFLKFKLVWKVRKMAWKENLSISRMVFQMHPKLFTPFKVKISRFW